MGKFIDMTGWIMKQHGIADSRITVLERDNNNKTKITKWICQCQCGTIFSADGTKIRNGWTRSCGCLQKETTSKRTRIDLTGQQFGYLTPIECLGTKGNTVLWKCKCKCGNITEGTSNNLLSGQKRSCGCLKSYGEKLVADFLSNNNISFQKEYNLGNLKNIPKSTTRIDFAVIKNNIPIGFIEVDGIQHYDKNNPWYNKGVESNSILKEQYCLNNNIPLLHLFYDQGTINYQDLKNFLNKLGE